MKLMILEKIRVIRTCSSCPHAASVFLYSFLASGYPALPGIIHPSVCLDVCTYLQIRY
jgi:hypothetical protein